MNFKIVIIILIRMMMMMIIIMDLTESVFWFPLDCLYILLERRAKEEAEKCCALCVT